MTESHATSPTIEAGAPCRWDGALEPVLDDEHLEAFLYETVSTLAIAERPARPSRLPFVVLLAPLIAALS